MFDSSTIYVLPSMYESFVSSLIWSCIFSYACEKDGVIVVVKTEPKIIAELIFLNFI